MDIKVEIQPKEIIAKVLTPVEPIYGGTKDYTNLENLPSINGYLLIGEMSLSDLGIQPVGDYAERSELPQNVSDLNNDAGYIVQSDLTDYAKLENLPTKVSQLENDSYYATKSDLPTKTSELENDSDLAYVTDIPTNVSELNNDSNYLVRSDISNLDNHVIDTDNPHKVLKSQVGLGNVDNTSDANKPVSIAQKKYIDESYANSNAYTDQKIADLIGGAPETLDTLKEVSDAISESKDVETALNNAIGTKANQTELDTHTGNDTIHITADERKNWNDANSKKHTHSNKSVIDKITQALIDSWNAAYNHISDTVKHITSDERTSWNNKYAKPSGGIPKTDLSSAVQTSLGKADTALQAHQDISGLATKTEFDKLNSNLDTLEFGEVAGGNNIWKYGDISNRLYYEFILKEPLPAGSYTLSAVITSSDTDSNISLIRIMNGSNDVSYLYFNRNSRQEKQFTADSEFNKIVFYASNTYNNSVNDTFSASDIQLELGLGTDYKPYIPSVKMLAEENTQQNTETMDLKMLGWTVPKECPVQNYVDSDSVFHQIVGRVDLGSLNWRAFDNTRFISNIETAKAFDDSIKANAFCKIYKTVSKNNVADINMSIGIDDAKNTWLRNDSYTDAAELKNSLQGVYLYYELETPITITIDGNEAVTQIKNDLTTLFSSNITSIKLNGSTLEVIFNNGTSVGKVSFEGIVEEETIIS